MPKAQGPRIGRLGFLRCWVLGLGFRFLGSLGFRDNEATPAVREFGNGIRPRRPEDDFLVPFSTGLEVPRSITESLGSLYWASVKELKLSYHNGYM